MTSEASEQGASATGRDTAATPVWHRPDGRRTLQLALATVWLLDGVLQLQPFMFATGSHGFSGMLGSMAAGNPSGVARSITWNATVVDHHAVAANSAFALIQILIGFGIAWRPTLRLALASSFVWSFGVWWFGEGLGGVLHGAGTPVGGGPGAVLTTHSVRSCCGRPTIPDPTTRTSRRARSVSPRRGSSGSRSGSAWRSSGSWARAVRHRGSTTSSGASTRVNRDGWRRSTVTQSCSSQERG